jgi:hypothetical protein
LSSSSVEQFEARPGTVVPAVNNLSVNLARIWVTAW